MKKMQIAAVAIALALVLVLAAAVALLYQPTSPGSGTLAILGTDPALTSHGVSYAHMHYSSVSAHRAGSSMSGGWVRVSGSGSMDLMAQGTGQVLATSKVNAADYDAFRFNVNSVDVVYQGQNYTASVATSTITAASQSKVNVNSSSSATALVDVRTFIQNTATTSSPQFVFSASAVATSVPAQATGSLSLQLGVTLDLSSQAWFASFESQTSANVGIVSATLAEGALNLTMQNSGDASGEVQEVIITPVSATTILSASLPSSLSGSAVFAVSGSGSLQQWSSLQASTLSEAGATVASGSTSSLAYSGNISMGGSAVSNSVVSGQQYVITCIGADTYASTTVVAS